MNSTSLSMRKGLSFLARDDFSHLLRALHKAGFQVIGPQVRDGTIVFDTLNNIEQLPQGVHDQQTPGSYRLETSDSPRYFAWANGPQAIKPLVFTPRETLWSSERGKDGSLSFSENTPEVKPTAIIGARPCDIAALYIQDKHFLQQEKVDPYYKTRREQLLLIVVNCTHPADSCFCASTGDGPEAHYGFDIALTELDDGFLISAHNQRGNELIAQLPTQAATEAQQQAAQHALKQTAEKQTRQLPTGNLNDKLFKNLKHPQWADIGERCLSCGNCTAVCPTCFCHSEGELAAFDGQSSEHTREWGSCFSPGHSYIHGITIRADASNKYRQWMTHKLGSWHAQYGRSGCVGCGRCITWCPPGIDITKEVVIICGDENE